MEVNCAECGIEFNRKPSKVKDKNFCSIKCASVYRTKAVSKKCDCCGEPITVRAGVIKTSTTNKFYCSKSCAVTENNKLRRNDKHANWRGGISTYRIRFLRETLNVCSSCGYDAHPEILEVHHIDEDRENNLFTNLEVLCPNCHALRHKLGI